ncbi:MAG: chromate efflux transporter [Cyanobacteria bacterium P01_D01_bin.73]
MENEGYSSGEQDSGASDSSRVDFSGFPDTGTSNGSSFDEGDRPESWGDRLQQLAKFFLTLGVVGFGGPAAHMAAMHDWAVAREGWLTEEELLEGVAVCEMLPGPASTQLGIYIGYQRGGAIGALVAGICFMAPAFAMVIALSWAYFEFQGLPQLTALLGGVSPVVVAVVAAFAWKLMKKCLVRKSGGFEVVAIALAVSSALAVGVVNLPVLPVLAIAGAVGIVAYGPHRSGKSGTAGFLPWFFGTELAILATQSDAVVGLTAAGFWGGDRFFEYAGPLFTVFFRAGTAIFGGGLSIVPLLETDVVQQWGWLTRTEFLNGVAIGQMTPGPVVLAVAFMGYKVAGVFGALWATVSAFTPSFGFIILLAPLLQRSRKNRWVKAFLKGVTPGVLGTIAAVTVPLAIAALGLEGGLAAVSWGFTAVAATLMGAAAIALIKFKVAAWKLLLAGALVGLITGSLSLT